MNQKIRRFYIGKIFNIGFDKAAWFEIPSFADKSLEFQAFPYIVAVFLRIVAGRFMCRY